MNCITLLAQRLLLFPKLKFAQIVWVSPIYLWYVERDKFNPASEEKIRAIPAVFRQDAAQLLAMVGRECSDLVDIIQRQPWEMATFLRAANGPSPKEMQRLAASPRQERRDPAQANCRRRIDA